jgi:uncharacterized protein involved in outer membrane biogenesis
VRPVRIGLYALGGVLLVLVAGLVALDRYVQSASFKQAILAAAQDALGTDVQVDELSVSLWSGASLRRIVVGSPPGFPGQLLTAGTLSVRYRLLPLLRRRLEIERVVLEDPVLRLARDATGKWSYEKVAARSPARAGRPGAAGPSAADGPLAAAPAAIEVTAPKLTLSRGQVVVLSETGRALVRVEQLDLEGGLDWAAGALSGRGQARIETLSAADALFLRRLTAPLTFAAQDVRMTPFRATLADGAVSGDLTFRLAGTGRYTARVEISDADVQRLLAEAGAARQPISGKLQARATLEGTGGLATLVGEGRAEIRDGQLLDVPVIGALAVALRLPLLRNLRFEECRIEFSLANGLMQTPVVRLIARDAQITGRGVVSLVAGTLDHRLTLALPKSVVDRAPREVRAAFAERPDGFQTIEFRMWGPYDALKTDLTDRLLKGVTEQFLRKGLRQLFR